MKSPVEDIQLIDKRNLEKKRYDQHKSLNPNAKVQLHSEKLIGGGSVSQSSPGMFPNAVNDADQGQGSDYLENGVKLDGNVQLNLENLVKIDEKFSQLVDCVKNQRVNNISQLCSDWWELTDEDDYSVAKFEKAVKEERVKRDVRTMMTLEILSIAVVNYYTSSPDVLKPTHLQIQQVKNLLSFI
mmetsp:Transcript_7515/g.12694  ORF Transcript_7515/g.12694 Transcript_7515/m.12694 type:complete len:185 (+) Transcript_7515:118-672(+)